MLKKRLIATLIVREGIVVQSINFRRYLPVGDPVIAVEYLNSWGIDEIIVVDISASKDRSARSLEHIKAMSRSCFVPLTVGGGIGSVEDIRTLMHYGADKVCINTQALKTPHLITDAAKVFGNQCIIVSIDVKGASPSDYRVYNAAEGKTLDQEPIEWAKQAEALGAGEIYLTSVDRDGSKRGFDLNLINLIARAVSIPVIASGGAGHPGHLCDVFAKTSASAVSAANYFHFAEHNVILAKAALKKNMADIRLNTHAHYADAVFAQDYRLNKKPEDILEDLMFERIVKEVI